MLYPNEAGMVESKRMMLQATSSCSKSAVDPGVAILINPSDAKGTTASDQAFVDADRLPMDDVTRLLEFGWILD
jgi:hypothetical protein